MTQVPHLDSRLASSLNLLNRGVLGTSVLAATSLADRAAEKLNGPYLYVPLVSEVDACAVCGRVQMWWHFWSMQCDVSYTR